MYASKEKDDILTYAREIPNLHPNLPEAKVYIPSHSLETTPWEAWQRGDVPSWWDDHNEVKHRRAANYHLANLENALEAVAGLLVLVAYHYKADWVNGNLWGKARFLYFDEPDWRPYPITDRQPLP
jgi:hypothetical protein